MVINESNQLDQTKYNNNKQFSYPFGMFVVKVELL